MVDKVWSEEQRWDREYDAGSWDHLETDSIEKTRSAIIAMYCNHLCPHGKILDVGCGAGILFDFLSPLQKKNYQGIEPSRIAANKAKAKRDLWIHIMNADDFHPDELFDAIVFNEVLYYLDYKKILKKYTSYLVPGGIIIVSTFRVKHPVGRLKGFRIWRTCRQLFSLIEQFTLAGKSQTKVLTWDLKIMKVKNP